MSNIPLQVYLDTEEQKEISPNQSIKTPSVSPSKLLRFQSELKLQSETQQSILEFLIEEREARKDLQAQIGLLLFSLTPLTFSNGSDSVIAKQNKEQHNLPLNFINLHDTNIVHNASVVNTPTAISQPANTSDKSISIPIKLIISIPSNDEQSSMPEIPQIVIDTPVADIAIIIDANDVSQAPREPDAVNNHQLVLLHSARSSITLYDISMVKATDYTLATRPQSPLLVHLVMTAHRLLHHPAYAQLVNLVPFDPGGK